MEVKQMAQGKNSSSRATSTSNGISRRGFASMDPAEVRRIAAKGGRASHGGGRSRNE